MRGVLLMALSNKFGWLVVATGNKSELSVGYATLYGDMAGGFALLKDVFKTDVFRLARHLNERAGRELIPQSIIDRAPSAELRDDQLDQDSLPPYAELDQVLEAYVELDRSREELLADGFDAGRRRPRAGDDRPRRVQAPPGAAGREAPPEGVRPRPADADHEPLAGLTLWQPFHKRSTQVSETGRDAAGSVGGSAAWRNVLQKRFFQLSSGYRRSSRSARNQRSRSAYGTAAFAGDVDGSTNSSVSRQPPLLQAVLRALAERAAVGLLADERDRARPELGRKPLEPLGRAREVGRPQVAEPGVVRAAAFVSPMPYRSTSNCSAGDDEPRREPGLVQQPPEVVPRVREVRRRGRRDPARVDPAEDDRQIRREDVRDGARRYAASTSGSPSGQPSSWCSSKSLTSCSPSSPPLGTLGLGLPDHGDRRSHGRRRGACSTRTRSGAGASSRPERSLRTGRTR